MNNDINKKIAPWLFLLSIFLIVSVEHFHPITNIWIIKLVNIFSIFGMLISVKLNRGVDQRIIISALIGLSYILMLDFIF